MLHRCKGSSKLAIASSGRRKRGTHLGKTLLLSLRTRRLLWYRFSAARGRPGSERGPRAPLKGIAHPWGVRRQPGALSAPGAVTLPRASGNPRRLSPYRSQPAACNAPSIPQSPTGHQYDDRTGIQAVRIPEPTSTTCCAPGNGWPPPSTASMTGHAPTPPPPRRRSPGSGGSSARSKAISPSSPTPNVPRSRTRSP